MTWRCKTCGAEFPTQQRHLRAVDLPGKTVQINCMAEGWAKV